MTDLITYPLTSDNDAPVNPWASPIVKAKIAERATLYNSNLPAATIAACEQNEASTKAWLAAHPDTVDEHADLFTEDKFDCEFRLADYLTADADYFVLHDAHLRACDAGFGPSFRAAVRALGKQQAAFLDHMIATNYSKVKAGEVEPLAGTLEANTEVPLPRMASMNTNSAHEARHMGDAPIPGPVPAKLEGRSQTITQRVISFCLTSSKKHNGAPCWTVCTRDGNGSHFNDFKEADSVCSQLFTRYVPFQRGENVHPDPVDITWKSVDGWCAAVSWKEIEDVAKANPNSEKLAEVFPRDENNQPVDAATNEPTPVLPWGDDNHLRGVFMARFKTEVWKPRGCPEDRAHAIRKSVLVREYGTDSLKGFNGNVEELLAKLTKAVEGEYPLAMAYFDEKAEKGTNGATGEAKPVAEPTRPVSEVKPIVPTSTTDQSQPVTDVTTEDLPLKLGPHHYEPEFVVLFEMYDTFGKQERFTIKADDEFTGYRRKKAFQEFLRGEGYTDLPKREAAPAALPQPAAVAPVGGALPAPVAPAPATTTGGVVVIREIQKVALDGKTRYELYDAPGAIKAALTVRPQQMVKRLIAPHINVDSMQPGTRYSVNWQCTWTPGNVNPNSNQPFKDLSAVQPLAAA